MEPNRSTEISVEDQELLDRAAAADEYGVVFKRPKTTGEKSVLFGKFRRVGRGPSAYSTAADGCDDFVVVLSDDGELETVYLSDREFEQLAQLAPKLNERLCLAFERISKKDGGAFNKLTFAKASGSAQVDWTAIRRDRNIAEPPPVMPDGAADAGYAEEEPGIDVDNDVPF